MRCPVLVRLLVSLALLLSLAVPSFAQNAGDAMLSGIVTDPSAAVIPGATVTLRQADTAYERTVYSAEDGRYRAAALPVGRYRIEVVVDGFQTVTRDAELTVGSSASLDIRMDIAGESVQVTVNASVPLTNPTETPNVSLIGEKAVADLPIRGRNFMEFAQLTPGASQEGDRGGLIVAGQRSINSNVAVDGLDFNDSLQGNQRGGNDGVFFFPQLAIREFQVVRSGAGAEVGRTNAAFVNAVTRSGSNNPRSEALYLNRNPTLTGKDAFGRTQDRSEERRVGKECRQRSS